MRTESSLWHVSSLNQRAWFKLGASRPPRAGGMEGVPGALLAPGTTTPSVRRAPPRSPRVPLAEAAGRAPAAPAGGEGEAEALPQSPGSAAPPPLLPLLPSNGRCGRCGRYAGVASGAQLAAERLRRLPLAARARRAGHRRQHLLHRALPQGGASLDAAVHASHIITKWRSTGKQTVSISYLL